MEFSYCLLKPEIPHLGRVRPLEPATVDPRGYNWRVMYRGTFRNIAGPWYKVHVVLKYPVQLAPVVCRAFSLVPADAVEYAAFAFKPFGPPAQVSSRFHDRDVSDPGLRFAIQVYEAERTAGRWDE